MPDYKKITDTSLPGQPAKKRGRPKLPRDSKGNAIHQAKEKHTFFCVCCGKPAKKLVYWGKAY